VETLVQDLNQDHAGLVERAAPADVMLLAQGIFGDPQRRDTDPDYAELVLRTNLLAPVRLLTLLAPYLRRRCLHRSPLVGRGRPGRAKGASTAPPRPASTRSSRPFASGCGPPECAFSP